MVDYTLSAGCHHNPEDGRCAMEWVSYIAGENHGHTPRCVDTALQGFAIGLNDTMGDEARQQLRPYLARMIGTQGDGMRGDRIRILRDLADTYGRPHVMPAHLTPWHVGFKTVWVIRAQHQSCQVYEGIPNHPCLSRAILPVIFEALEAMLPTVPVEIPAEGQVELERLVSAGV